MLCVFSVYLFAKRFEYPSYVMILLWWVLFIPWYDIHVGDNMIGAACGAGNAYPFGAPEIHIVL